MGILYGTGDTVTSELVLCLDAANPNSFDPNHVVFNGPAVNAQTAYTSSGTNSFVVPVGITSISAVSVGGGGGGGGNTSNNSDAAAGGGGGLSYGTFAVTPGETLTIVVGSAGACSSAFVDGTSGGDSQIKRGSTVLLQGEGGGGGTKATVGVYGVKGDGGTSTGTVRDGGGTGGDGGNGGGGGGGGGGAAGYSGNGGVGRNFPGAGAGGDGAGGGGGGAGANGSSGNSTGNNKGGGVGILGEGSNGEGGAAYNAGSPGSGGSGVTYGGGGGGAYRNTASAGKSGGVGAVRLVYQPLTIGNRQYPTLANIADTTYSGPTTPWNDVYGNVGIATLTGATYNSDNGGNISFNGNNGVYASFTPGSANTFGTSNYSIEIWINRYSGAFIYDTRSEFSGDHPYIMIDDNRFAWRPYGAADRIFEDDTNNPTFTNDTWSGWRHYVINRESTGFNGCKLYYNGSLVAQGDDNQNHQAASNVKIGSRYDSNAFGFNGKIGLFKIYKGRALTAAEILQNYNALKGRYI
tara:strand:- start:1883 stop:3442 length:1560 start_codon:yes stop_codon:yes gene_type:complete